MSCDSCPVIIPKLLGRVEHSPELYGFSTQFPLKKLGGHLLFFLSSSNRNRGKGFAALSKKTLVHIRNQGAATAATLALQALPD